MRNIGWPSPQNNSLAQALTPPWTSLVPRDIPYLKETDVQVADLIQAIAIEWAIPERQKENFSI